MGGDKPFAELGAMSPCMKALAKSQDIIGYRNLMKGYILTHFYTIQSFHLTMSSSYPNGTEWAKQFISKLLRVTHSQWIFRNISLHDKINGYLHKKKSEEILLELEFLTGTAPEEVPAESQFLLEINFSKLSKFHTESQKYWISAVNAALTAKQCLSALGAHARQVRDKVNRKLFSQTKLGIVATEQQIRWDLCHSLLCQEEHMRFNTSNQSSLDRLVSKRPHPVSILNLMRPNECLQKPD
jgi:hypothetical protein